MALLPPFGSSRNFLSTLRCLLATCMAILLAQGFVEYQGAIASGVRRAQAAAGGTWGASAQAEEASAQAAAGGVLRGEAVAARAGGQGGGRAVLAVFGLSNRARGCTEQSHREYIKRVLEEEGYSVETYVFETIPFGVKKRGRGGAPILVDHMLWNETACSYTHDVCETRSASEIDLENEDLSANISFANYRLKDKRNALRQLYAEYRVGLFLRSRAKNTTLAVAVGQDVFIPRAIVAGDVRLAASNKSVAFTAQNSDGKGGGYTNGFYMGSTAVLAEVMSRLEELQGQPKVSDATYEKQLKDAFLRHNITRRVFQGFEQQFFAFAKIRYNGHHFSSSLPLPSYVTRCLNRSLAK